MPQAGISLSLSFPLPLSLSYYPLSPSLSLSLWRALVFSSEWIQSRMLRQCEEVTESGNDRRSQTKNIKKEEFSILSSLVFETNTK